MAFHEIVLPTRISLGAVGGPGFRTSIVSGAGGFEQRNQRWTYALGQWDVSYALQSEAHIAELIDFFHARRGALYGFRFKDFVDYQATRESCSPATGDAVETEFQLAKQYTDAGDSYTRLISKPTRGTQILVYVNDVRQMSGWSLDDTTGLITFGSAPADGATVKATYSFEVPVRFDTDRMPRMADLRDRTTWRNIPVTELRVAAA